MGAPYCVEGKGLIVVEEVHLFISLMSYVKGRDTEAGLTHDLSVRSGAGTYVQHRAYISEAQEVFESFSGEEASDSAFSFCSSRRRDRHANFALLIARA